MRALLAASQRAAGLSRLHPAQQQARNAHLAARRLVVCEAERQQQGEASTQQTPTAAGAPAPPAAPRPAVRVPPQQRRMPPPPPSPFGENVEVCAALCRQHC